MRYTAKYFRDNFPEWKRIKDPITLRIFYRPVSFHMAAFCANHGIQANTVSVFSTFIAVIACFTFLFADYWCNIAAALLLSLWMLLDCTDGNLARSIKPQPFGEFVDSESSYTLVAFLGSCVGMSVYFTEGAGVIFRNGNAWGIFAGAMASASDTLMRLIYQKYQNVAGDLSAKKIIPPHREKRTEHEYSASLRVRLEQWPGIGGFLLPLILVAAVFNALDLIVIYMVIYYCGGAAVMITFYTVKAMRFRNLPIESQM